MYTTKRFQQLLKEFEVALLLKFSKQLLLLGKIESYLNNGSSMKHEECKSQIYDCRMAIKIYVCSITANKSTNLKHFVRLFFLLGDSERVNLCIKRLIYTFIGSINSVIDKKEDIEQELYSSCMHCSIMSPKLQKFMLAQKSLILNKVFDYLFFLYGLSGTSILYTAGDHIRKLDFKDSGFITPFFQLLLLVLLFTLTFKSKHSLNAYSLTASQFSGHTVCNESSLKPNENSCDLNLSRTATIKLESAEDDACQRVLGLIKSYMRPRTLEELKLEFRFEHKSVQDITTCMLDEVDSVQMARVLEINPDAPILAF